MTRLYILDVSPPPVTTQPLYSIQRPLRHNSSYHSYSSGAYSSGFTSSSMSSSMSSHDDCIKSVRFSKVVVVNNPTIICLVQGETPGRAKDTIDRHCLKL